MTLTKTTSLIPLIFVPLPTIRVIKFRSPLWESRGGPKRQPPQLPSRPISLRLRGMALTKIRFSLLPCLHTKNETQKKYNHRYDFAPVSPIFTKSCRGGGPGPFSLPLDFRGQYQAGKDDHPGLYPQKQLCRRTNFCRPGYSLYPG